jgi:hypothetical protein
VGQSGEVGGQVGMQYQNGELISFFYFDSVEAQQTNLEGEPTTAGPTITPLSPTKPSGSSPMPTFQDGRQRCSDVSAAKRTGSQPTLASAGSSPCGCPPAVLVWLTFGLRPAGHRDEAWLKKGLPCS